MLMIDDDDSNFIEDERFLVEDFVIIAMKKYLLLLPWHILQCDYKLLRVAVRKIAKWFTIELESSSRCPKQTSSKESEADR